jgi:hypothetical protein
MSGKVPKWRKVMRRPKPLLRHTGQVIPKEEWSSEKDFDGLLPGYRSPPANNQSMLKHIHHSASASQWTVSFEKSSGWLCGTYTGDNHVRRLCWIPNDRRPDGTNMLANHGHTTVFAANGSLITTLDFSKLFSLVESLLKL